MHTRFIVIGAGMAGASAAFELAADGSPVLILEQEDTAGYHTTGRSVAIYSETYGNATIRALNTGSRAFLVDPPPGFAEHPLLYGPGGELLIGRQGSETKLDGATEAFRRLVPGIRRLSVDETVSLVPVLRRDWLAGSLYEPGAMHMDVHAIHQGYMRGVKARGGHLRLGSVPRAVMRKGDLWHVEAGGEVYTADMLVNAAGAWADEVATLAGVQRIGLVPKRRTAAIVPLPAQLNASAWPFVVDLEESFYFKPESGRLLISPAEETDMPPGDVYPDDEDIAVAANRIEQATTLTITRVERSWAGLRSFVRDRSPVIGPDPGMPGFIWCAGQGGYGIQAAPAMARATAALAKDCGLPSDLLDLGLSAEAILPGRLFPAATIS